MTTTEQGQLIHHLAREFIRLHPMAAAAELESEEATRFLTGVPRREAAELLIHLDSGTAAQALAGMDPDVAARIVEIVEHSRAALILSRVEKGAKEELLDQLEPEAAQELRELLSYPQDRAGAQMDTEVLALKSQRTVGDALRKLKTLRHKRIHRVFLIDDEQRLLGSLSIRDLALAEHSVPLKDLDVAPPTAVLAMASLEEVAETLNQTHATSLPVVDVERRLLGVLRHDALVEVAREDATADMQSMFGAGKEERALSRVSFAVRKRLPWLQINLLTAFLAASVVGAFEQTIARFTALAILLPVVAGQSGNTGAQALAVTMRGLTLREIRPRQWARVCAKELSVGALNGVAVALTTSLGVLIWSRSVGLALIIGSSMVLSMIAAGLSGAAVPLVLTTLRQDPAQSSSIILTTITDVVGFFTFLGIATLLMGMLID